MKFVLNRNKVIGGTSGHFIEFKKGIAIEVPKVMWEAVMSAGATPESEIPEDEIKPVVILDSAERQSNYFKAFSDIIARNERGDFTASGLPNSKVLERLLGHQVINKERDMYWVKYQGVQDEGAE